MYFQMFERLVFRFKYVNVSVSEHVSCHIIQRFLFKFRRNTVSWHFDVFCVLFPTVTFISDLEHTALLSPQCVFCEW